MPPITMWLRGVDELRGWYLGYGIGCKGSRLLPVDLNGSPGFAHYKPAADGGHEPWCLQVLEISDGRIGHVELSFGGAIVMMADPHPEVDVDAPEGRGAAVTLYLTTDDVDGLAYRARDQGATLDREPEASDHGRIAVFRDPFGHRWMLSAP